MRRQLILVLTVAVLGLVAASAYARAAGQGGAADSSRGKEWVAPLPKSEAPDTSMFNGSGLNSLSVPIDRPVSGGVMRKDPGTRTWYFIKGMTDAEAKAAYEKFRREMLARHGDEPREIVFPVRDSADVVRLRGFNVPISGTPPCTLAVRVKYRQLPEFRKAGLVFWGKGSLRADTTGTKPQLPHKASEKAGLRKSSRLEIPRPLQDFNQPPSIQSVTIYSEDFETSHGIVPGTYWGVTNSGADWGDVSSNCGALAHGESWSVFCNGYGFTPTCATYLDNQYTELAPLNPTYFTMSAYSTYQFNFWAWYHTEYDFDFFYFEYYVPRSGWVTNYRTYSGSSAGWFQDGVAISNATHDADSFTFRFRFTSDVSITDTGVYIDDIAIQGTAFQPNLSYYTPPGWSGAIVPSSVQGTSTTGTLYAGQPTYIDWAVANFGDGNAGGFYVYFYLDGGYIGSWYVSSLPAGNYTWNPDWSYIVSTTGNHTLKMVIDATGTVAESNESDNTYQQNFTWNNPPPPDLIVQSIAPSSSNPVIGQSISATITVKNQGAGTANGTFYTDCYKNVASPPTQGQYPYDDRHTTFSLAAGATETYTVLGLTSSVAGTWKLGAYVDGSDTIANESSETNNSYWPVTVTWNPGTTVVSGLLAYDDASYTGATNVQNRPVRSATVELWRDLGGGGNTQLATASTDATGHYTFPAVVNDGSLNVYVAAYCQSNAGRTAADAGVINASFQTYTFRTTTFTNVPLGTWTAPTYKPTDYTSRSALHIYDAMLNGYAWASGQGVNTSLPYGLRVQWQAGVNYSTSYVGYDPNTGKQAMQLCGAYSPASYVYGPDEWDDTVLLHEYGHHLQYLFDFSGNVGGPHSPTTAETPELAFSEGSAHFLCAAMLSSPRRRNVGIDASFYETHVLESDLNTGWVGQDSVLSWYVGDQGPTYEIAVGGYMWDVIDAANDTPNGCADVVTEPVGDSWTVLVSHPGATGPATLADFARWYCQRYGYGNPTLAAGLTSTLCKHGIPAVGCGTTAVGGNTPTDQGWISVAPNPLRCGGQVSFRIPSSMAGSGSLSLYDLRGRRVAVLGRGPFVVGVHAGGIDGPRSGIRPGLYLCRLDLAAGVHYDTRLLVVR